MKDDGKTILLIKAEKGGSSRKEKFKNGSEGRTK